MSLRSGLVSSKVPLLVRHYHRCRCVVVLSGSDTAVGPCRVVARAVRDPVTSRSVGSCYMTRAAQLLPSRVPTSVQFTIASVPDRSTCRYGAGRHVCYVLRPDTYRGRPCPTRRARRRYTGGPRVLPAYRGARPAGRCISAPDTRRPLSLVVRGCVEMRTHKLEMRTRARGFVGPRSS